MKKTKIIVFVFTFLLLFSSCSADSATVVAPDFEFSLTWDSYGMSYYDSTRGELIKSKNSSNPDSYITTLFLDDEQKEIVKTALSKLDLTKYPERYDPNKNEVSSPPMTIILTIQFGETIQKISCEEISLSYESKDPDGQAFLTACRSIIDLIVSTEEWKALPEYEVFYQ